jgi:RNA polymerase sigma-70 factor (ECF subfamily)
MTSADAFTQYRALLFSLAYRMLGSVQDAEDMVQDAFVRWSQVSPDAVDSPKDYLCATVTRLCIDHLRSARVRREAYVGVWLPEPLVTDEGPDPSDALMMDESLSTAFLFLLESLSPVERAVLLLRDVFAYEYSEVARMVGKTEANCRQIARRARQRLAEKRPRFDVAPAQVESLTNRFVAACAGGDLDGLLGLLADDVTLWSDGGGRARAAINPIHGADDVARFMVGVTRKYGPALRVSIMPVNGRPSIVRYIDDCLQGVVSLDIADGRIQQVFMMLNPDKLHTVPQRRGASRPGESEGQA